MGKEKSRGQRIDNKAWFDSNHIYHLTGPPPSVWLVVVVFFFACSEVNKILLVEGSYRERKPLT